MTDQDPETGISYMRYGAALLNKVRRHHKLLLFLVLLSIAGGVSVVSLVKPEYTATATLGAAPSPLDDLVNLSGGLGGSLGSSITKKLGLGATAGSSDLFDQYVELLSSSRLAERLAEDPNILRALFPRRYDWKKHRWVEETGPIALLKNSIKRLFHYPIKIKPDRDDVKKLLNRFLTVDAPLTSSFVTVSLESTSPEKATWLLSVMLSDADAIIRSDRRRDIGARIVYLSQIISTVTQSDQRQSLSTILSDQQQTMMMIRADKRYASALIDPPHAPNIPTSPNLLLVFGLSLLIAILLWGAAVFFLPANHLIFRRPFPRRAAAVTDTSKLQPNTLPSESKISSKASLKDSLISGAE